MPLSKTSIFTLAALTGALTALVLGPRRRSGRAEAIHEKVQAQEWEGAPIPPPAPENTAGDRSAEAS
jgi:hypothetical protein